MKVGEAKFGSRKKFFKFEDGDNVFRILPALGELADKGIWSVYYKVCWGYKNAEGRTRLFQDCREVNYQTKMVEVESAAYQRIESLKAKQAELKKSGADKATMDKMTKLLMQYNIEGKHHVNAVNLKGEIGLLKIGHKAKLALDALIKKLREEEGINPLAIENGLYVNFNRTGRGRDTIYQVSAYQQKREDGSRVYVYHTMDEGFQSRLDQEAFNLKGMYPAPTPEEIEQIVSGGPEVVDSILNKYKKVRPSSTTETKSSEPDTESNVSSQGSSSESTEDVDKLMKQETSSTEAADNNSEGTTENEAPPVQTDSGMSDEDFLNMIENG